MRLTICFAPPPPQSPLIASGLAILGWNLPLRGKALDLPLASGCRQLEDSADQETVDLATTAATAVFEHFIRHAQSSMLPQATSVAVPHSRLALEPVEPNSSS